MANITLGQLRDLWKNVSDWVTGGATHEPKVQLSGRKSLVSIQGTTNVDSLFIQAYPFAVESVDFISNDSDIDDLYLWFNTCSDRRIELPTDSSLPTGWSVLDGLIGDWSISDGRLRWTRSTDTSHAILIMGDLGTSNSMEITARVTKVDPANVLNAGPMFAVADSSANLGWIGIAARLQTATDGPLDDQPVVRVRQWRHNATSLSHDFPIPARYLENSTYVKLGVYGSHYYVRVWQSDEPESAAVCGAGYIENPEMSPGYAGFYAYSRESGAEAFFDDITVVTPAAQFILRPGEVLSTPLKCQAIYVRGTGQANFRAVGGEVDGPGKTRS